MRKVVGKKSAYVEDPSDSRHVWTRKFCTDAVVGVQYSEDFEGGKPVQGGQEDDCEDDVEGDALIEASICSS
jgi:hypothetical protein